MAFDCEVPGHLSLQPGQASQKLSDGAVHSSPSDSFANDIEKAGSRMENVWRRTMHEQYQVSDRYSQLAALIVRWDDELDKDLNCKHEVEELNSLFNDEFKFTSKNLKLDTRSRPQQQLNHAVGELVLHHDGPCQNHLLIVYYSGHGIARGEGDLELAGKPKDDCTILEGGGRYEPKLSWLLAERDLDHAESDVLIVLDCCRAANIMKKEMSDDTKAHEVLAASGRLQVADPPGPRSFSRHFIDALKEELAKNDRQPFTTYDLNAEINRRRLHITQIESRIFNRHANARNKRHIALAPLDHLKPSDTTETSLRQRRARDAASLDLRVAFKNRTTLRDDEVQRLATKMFEAAKGTNLGINSIDWMGFKPRKEVVQLQQNLRRIFHAVYYAKRWKRLTRRSKKRKAGTMAEDGADRATKRVTTSALLAEPLSASKIGPLSPPPSSPSGANSPQPDI